jgi:hypothetical protein
MAARKPAARKPAARKPVARKKAPMKKGLTPAQQKADNRLDKREGTLKGAALRRDKALDRREAKGK